MWTMSENMTVKAILFVSNIPHIVLILLPTLLNNIATPIYYLPVPVSPDCSFRLAGSANMEKSNLTA